MLLGVVAMAGVTAACAWAFFDLPLSADPVERSYTATPLTNAGNDDARHEPASARRSTGSRQSVAPAGRPSTEARLARLEEALAGMQSQLAERDQLIAELREQMKAGVGAFGDTVEGDEGEEGATEGFEWAEDGEIDPADVVRELTSLRDKLKELEETGTSNVLREFAARRVEMTGGQQRLLAMRDLARLSKEGDPEAAVELQRFLEAKNAGIRADAARALGELRDPQWASALMEASQDDNAAVRATAADALGRMPGEVVGDQLLGLLDDGNRRVRVEAVQSLGATKYDRALPELVHLANGRDRNLAYHAAVAMRKMGDESAARQMTSEIGDRLKTNNTRTRRYVIRQLGYLAVEDTRPYLEQALKDKDRDVRDQAKRALRNLDRARNRQ